MLPTLYGGPATATGEWGTLIRQFVSQAEQLVDGTARPLRIWERNGLAALLADAADLDAPFADSGMTVRRAREIDALFHAFQLWLATPVTIGQGPETEPVAKPPIDILSAR